MRVFLFLALAGCASHSTSSRSCAHDSKTLRCVKFVRNYDADTITFDIPNVHPLFGKNISVRVLGVDTAEMKGHGPCEREAARKAKALVYKTLTASRQIELVNLGRDKYFRILADVKVNGASIAEILIKSGLAVPYDGGTKQKIDWCKSGPYARVNSQAHHDPVPEFR